MPVSVTVLSDSLTVEAELPAKTSLETNNNNNNETVIPWTTCPPTGLEGESVTEVVEIAPDANKKYALYSPGYLTDLVGYPNAATAYYTCRIKLKVWMNLSFLD